MTVGLLSFASAPAAPPAGITINLTYETSAQAAPQSFRDGMQAAANLLMACITNPITVTILVGYGDWDNGLATVTGGSAEGSDLAGDFLSYSSIRAALAAGTISATRTSFVNALPNASSIDGHSTLYVTSAQQKALGIGTSNPAFDGAIGIGTGVPTANLVGVGLHEITHCLGREPQVNVFALGRFTASGTRLYTSAIPAAASYFSIDNGVTKLADYGRTSDPGDFLNGPDGTGVQDQEDSFNEFYDSGTHQTLTTLDKQLLDCLGFTVV